MCVDFRRKPYTSIQTVIKGQTIEQVQRDKYLGTIIDNKLTFKDILRRKFVNKLNNNSTSSRSSAGLVCVLNSVESVITFSVITWFGNLSVGDRKRLQHIVKVASKITGVKLPDLSHIFSKRATVKARNILQFLFILCMENLSFYPPDGDLDYQRPGRTG